MTHEDYLGRVTQYIKADEKELEKFKAITTYHSGLYDDDASWKSLDDYLVKNEKERGVSQGHRNRVFYMALPPSVFIPVAKGVKKSVYSADGVNRLIVEKPFGMDTESSNELGRELGALFKEEEVSCNIHSSASHVTKRSHINDVNRFTVLIIISAKKWSRTS